MKKTITITGLLAIFSMIIVTAQLQPATVDTFTLLGVTDTTDSLYSEITLPDSGYYYVLRDYDSSMTNAIVVVPGTLLFGHGTTAHITFTDDSLIPGVAYVYMIVAVCDYTVPITRDSSFLAVNTAVKAQVNNLLGNFTQTSPIHLTVDYMAHSFATTIKYVRVSDGVVVAVHSGLFGNGIKTDSVSFVQTANTTQSYVAVAWNVFNSNTADYDTSNSWTVSTQGSVIIQPPVIDSLSASLITTSGLNCYISWNSDSLPGTLYLYAMCNGVLPGNIVTIFSVPPGAGDTLLYVPFSCPGSMSIGLMGVLENAHNGLDYDTVIQNYALPANAPTALVPYAVWIDSVSMTALIQVDSITANSPNAFIQLEAIDVDTANNGAFAIVIPLNSPVLNCCVSHVFFGLPGHCYYLRAVLVDGNIITQTWYIQSTPVCFPGFNGVDEVESQQGWNNGHLELRPKDFPAKVTTTDMSGRIIAKGYYSTWVELYYSLPEFSGIVILSSRDEKTGLERRARIAKVSH